MGAGIVMRMLKTGSKFVSKNLPTVLTGLSVCGTVATAFLAAEGVLNAQKVLEQHDADDYLMVNEDDRIYYRDFTFKEKAKLTWKCFIPAGLMCIGTISCTIGANTVNLKRNSALAAAYSLSEEAAKEFRAKATEMLGEKKVEKIDSEVMQEKVKNQPVPDEENIFYTRSGEDLFYDSFSGRFFRASKKGVEDAELSVNRKMLRDNMASVNDFYDYLGLPCTEMGDKLGWVRYTGNDDEAMRIEFYPVFSSKMTPCIGIRFEAEPTYDYRSIYDR